MMSYSGFVLQILNILILLGWIVLSLIAWFGLRDRNLASTAKALWALVICVPILGAIAFWIVNPKDEIE
jgi:hypothetical protein